MTSTAQPRQALPNQARQRLACHVSPLHAWSGHVSPCPCQPFRATLALPSQPRHPRLALSRCARPSDAPPDPALPASSSPALRRSASPGPARPCRACHAQSSQNTPSTARPGRAWTGRVAPPLAQPRLPRQSWPGRASSRYPYLACHAPPSLVTHCLAQHRLVLACLAMIRPAQDAHSRDRTCPAGRSQPSYFYAAARTSLCTPAIDASNPSTSADKPSGAARSSPRRKCPDATSSA